MSDKELVSKVEELDLELEKLSDAQSYQQALEHCPSLLDDAFKIAFLRCDDLNAKVR